MSRVRGLLTQSGEWQCECTPRLPAIWLEVKKNNQNKVPSETNLGLTVGATLLYVSETTGREMWILFMGY